QKQKIRYLEQRKCILRSEIRTRIELQQGDGLRDQDKTYILLFLSEQLLHTGSELSVT
ncbi:hypothetical protein WUBG_14060, partial [Wuchereria bancrofti]